LSSRGGSLRTGGAGVPVPLFGVTLAVSAGIRGPQRAASGPPGKTGEPAAWNLPCASHHAYARLQRVTSPVHTALCGYSPLCVLISGLPIAPGSWLAGRPRSAAPSANFFLGVEGVVRAIFPSPFSGLSAPPFPAGPCSTPPLHPIGGWSRWSRWSKVRTFSAVSRSTLRHLCSTFDFRRDQAPRRVMRCCPPPMVRG